MEAADFPVGWVSLAYWAICSLQKGIAYDNYPPFFLIGAVIMCGTDLLVLGNPLDGASLSSSFAWTSHSRAPYLS